MDQLRFFDHWLKGIDTGIMDEPPVKLMIRTGGDLKNYKFRFENEWPLARTQWTKMYLKLNAERQSATAKPEGELVADAAAEDGQGDLSRPARPSHAGVSSSAPSLGLAAAWGAPASRSRPRRCAEDTEITGPMVLVLWVSSSSEDMDIFATIRNIGPDGKDVWEVGPAGLRRGAGRQGLAARLAPQARSGALAALSPVSRARRAAVARARRAGRVPRGDLADAAWCSGKGHRIRLDVQPRDGVGASVYRHYQADYNIGAQKHRPCRRGARIVSAASGHSADVKPTAMPTGPIACREGTESC